MQKTHQPIHPIEALILAVLLVITAAYELAVSLLALVLALLPPRKSVAGTAARPFEQEPATLVQDQVEPEPVAPAPPAVAPLLAELEGLTVRQLRTVAGTASKRLRKAELIDLAGIAMAC